MFPLLLSILFISFFSFTPYSSSILSDNPIILKLFLFSQFSRLSLFLTYISLSPSFFLFLILSKKREFQYLHRYRYFQNCSPRYYMGTSSIIKGCSLIVSCSRFIFIYYTITCNISRILCHHAYLCLHIL